MDKILITFGVISIIVYVWSTIMIYSFLKDKNVKLNSFIFINLFIFKYVQIYKKIGKKENGKIGNLYYCWLVSINVALLCFLLLILIK